jgi:uncharacterized membrane protein YvlD (DUF360 family)
MFYLKSLLTNFLTVFFANHILPGMQIAYYSRLPKIEGDLIFALGLGLISSLVFPVMRLFRVKTSHLKIGLITFVISFVAYSIVNLLPLGIKVVSTIGYLSCSIVVWLVSYLTNHLAYRHYLKKIDHDGVVAHEDVKEDEVMEEGDSEEYDSDEEEDDEEEDSDEESEK